MLKKLEDMPASEAYVRRSRGLRIAGTILAAVGGGLIGWSLGQKLGGHESPNWTFAYIGAGVSAGLGFPLALSSIAPLNHAIQTHNDALAHALENKTVGITIDPARISEQAVVDGVTIFWVGRPRTDPGKVTLRIQQLVRTPELQTCRELELELDGHLQRHPVSYRKEGTSPVRESIELATTIDVVSVLASARRVELNLCGKRRKLSVAALDSARAFVDRFTKAANATTKRSPQAPGGAPQATARSIRH